MAENAFDTSWLNERFRFDEAARNVGVDKACLQFLSTFNLLQLVDVGSGTGANFLHFFEALSQNQNWYFIDHDPRLLQASLDRIATVAKDKGYTVRSTTDNLELAREKQLIHIQTISGSFETLETLVDLTSINLVMASAFFDLFRPDQLGNFIDKVLNEKAALLLTLNYTAMNFEPALAQDSQMIQWYEGHMQRPRPGGAAMGPQCSVHIQSLLEKKALQLFSGPSVWQVKEKEEALLTFLLGFMQEAIGEMISSEKEKAMLEHWLQQRIRQKENKALSLKVEHQDFFAY